MYFAHKGPDRRHSRTPRQRPGGRFCLFMIVRTDFPYRRDHLFHLFIRQRIIKRDTDDSLIKPLRLRTEPRRVSQLLIVRKKINRDIMNLTVNIFGIHGIKKPASAAGEYLGIKLQDIQMPCGIRLGNLFLDSAPRYPSGVRKRRKACRAGWRAAPPAYR